MARYAYKSKGRQIEWKDKDNNFKRVRYNVSCTNLMNCFLQTKVDNANFPKLSNSTENIDGK